MNDSQHLATAEAEIERLENIVKIQQKQIERLIDERDVILGKLRDCLKAIPKKSEIKR